MKHLKWIASSWKRLGFDSDTCNHIKSALLSTCSVPIQVCQFGKFQKPVDFIISNVFPLKLPLIYQANLESGKEKTYKKPQIIAWIKEPATTDRRCKKKKTTVTRTWCQKSTSDGIQFSLKYIEATYLSNICFWKSRQSFQFDLSCVLCRAKNMFFRDIVNDERMWITIGLSGAVVKEKSFWDEMDCLSISSQKWQITKQKTRNGLFCKY